MFKFLFLLLNVALTGNLAAHGEHGGGHRGEGRGFEAPHNNNFHREGENRHFDQHNNEFRNDNIHHNNVNVWGGGGAVVEPAVVEPIIVPENQDNLYYQNQQN